jgi:hypothetical protein
VQSKFYNQPAANRAMQNLQQPVEIKMRFASRRARLVIYALLFSAPFLIIAGQIFLKLTGGAKDTDRWDVGLCGGAFPVPPAVITLLGVLTQQKFVKSLRTASNLLWDENFSGSSRITSITFQIRSETGD